MNPSQPSTDWLTGIDHPVVAVNDMARARVAYERLGFTIPPRGRHAEWGTGNWCIMFPDNYLELRGIIREGHTHNLQEFLHTRGEGLMGLAFGTTDAEASRAALVERGFHPEPVRGLTREIELPEGSARPRFSLCFMNEHETAGLMSVVFCQHLTPELIRRAEWLDHPNAACGVISVIGTVDDLAAAARIQARLFGAEAVEQVDEELKITTPAGSIVFTTSAEITRRYPEANIPRSETPRLEVIRIQSADLQRTARTLASADVPFYHTDSGGIVVPYEEACGATIEFVAASTVIPV